MKERPIRRPKPPPAARFAVVLDQGTLFETVDVYAGTLRDAEVWAADMREPGVDVTVMRVMADGSLTIDLF